MSRAAERPKQATTPQQVWFVDLRYLVQIDGQWLYSVLIFDGYSRAIVGAGCFERQNLSRVVQVVHQAIVQWGAPAEVVSDHGAVFLALAPCLRQLDIQLSLLKLPVVFSNLYGFLPTFGDSRKRNSFGTQRYAIG